MYIIKSFVLGLVCTSSFAAAPAQEGKKGSVRIAPCARRNFLRDSVIPCLLLANLDACSQAAIIQAGLDVVTSKTKTVAGDILPTGAALAADNRCLARV
jgi:hypothetical protein